MLKKIAFLFLIAMFLLAPQSYGYKDVNPKEVSKNLKRYMDKQIKFTDRVLFVWKTQPLAKKDKSGFIKFETQNLRCIISERSVKHLDFIRKRLKKSQPRYLTFYGSVVKKFEFQYFVEITRIEFPKYVKKSSSSEDSDE